LTPRRLFIFSLRRSRGRLNPVVYFCSVVWGGAGKKKRERQVEGAADVAEKNSVVVLAAVFVLLRRSAFAGTKNGSYLFLLRFFRCTADDCLPLRFFFPAARRLFLHVTPSTSPFFYLIFVYSPPQSAGALRRRCRRSGGGGEAPPALLFQWIVIRKENKVKSFSKVKAWHLEKKILNYYSSYAVFLK
jgi:hypothetical protein